MGFLYDLEVLWDVLTDERDRLWVRATSRLKWPWDQNMVGPRPPG